MEIIWTVVCGKMLSAKDFNLGSQNPTLTTMLATLRSNGCPKYPISDFEISLICSEDTYDFWHGSHVVNFADVENYEYPELKQALIKACGHGYQVYLCLSREPDPERENLATFATFLLAYQPSIQRPLGAEWTYTWEISSGAATRITYSEVRKLCNILDDAKLLHL